MLKPHAKDPNREKELERFKDETNPKTPSRNTFSPHDNRTSEAVKQAKEKGDK